MKCPSCHSDNVEQCDPDLPLQICLNCQYVWDESKALDEFDIQQHQILSAGDLECGNALELAQAKIEARERLLAMPPKEAQELVNMTLYPQYWSCNTEEFVWEESIPTHYGETDS